MSDDRNTDQGQAQQQGEEPRRSTLPAVMGAIAIAEEQTGYIRPNTIEEAYEFARLAVHLAPDSYKGDIKQVTIGIMAALEAGLPPLYGLRNIAIINGRPTIWGDAAMALVQAKNLIAKQKVVEIGQSFDKSSPINDWPDDFGFAASLWRRGQEEPYVGKFTVGDAKRAKLWMNTRKVPWIEHPLRMLGIRARSWALRDGFADALAGLAIREEVEDMHDDQPKAISTTFLDDPEPEGDDAQGEGGEARE